ncbi:UNVERIFIED_CONTAM: Transposon Ty3-I Gag-Pol polyprotein [Sesamum calycinum]|uniref:Transposon Ty3-I Gag-Pol polyprotein n=1 Tax=Sesamum calycinum TaxID=2727403 RepID=A0AAW2Q3S6_9LAMI
MAVPLDGFDVILGVDFMLLANAMVIPYLNGLFIADQNSTCFVPGTYLQDSVRSTEKKDNLISAMQVKAGLRHGEQTYLAAVVEINRMSFRKFLTRWLSCYRSSRMSSLLNCLRSYPHDLFDKLTKAKYCTKIDLRSGYWQVRVARATFCDLMNDVLYELRDRFVVVYLDDIVIYSESLNDHLKHLRAVFKKLIEYELYAKKEKCEFCCEQITFLGHVISQGKIQMDRKKVDASDSALGGVLVQDKHPIAFESRKLKDAELRCSTHEKEMTAVRKLSPKQTCWQEFFGEFDFEWVHRPGKDNDVAVALSRKQVEEYVAALTEVESDFLDQIQESSKMDVGYLKLLLRETHDPQWVGHPGINRMLALLARRYYWPKIDEDVEAYRCRGSLLLRTLFWVFPKVNGMASVLVVVDHFSKYGIFIATPHACPVETAAELFYKNVTKYFGVPQDIISDRDTRFTERFWTALFNMMGMKLKFSTANHPQTDGQTERMNALVENYLRYYVSVSQRNWVDLLDVA